MEKKSVSLVIRRLTVYESRIESVSQLSNQFNIKLLIILAIWYSLYAWQGLFWGNFFSIFPKFSLRFSCFPIIFHKPFLGRFNEKWENSEKKIKNGKTFSLAWVGVIFLTNLTLNQAQLSFQATPIRKHNSAALQAIQ